MNKHWKIKKRSGTVSSDAKLLILHEFNPGPSTQDRRGTRHWCGWQRAMVRAWQPESTLQQPQKKARHSAPVPACGPSALESCRRVWGLLVSQASWVSVLRFNKRPCSKNKVVSKTPRAHVHEPAHIHVHAQIQTDTHECLRLHT